MRPYLTLLLGIVIGIFGCALYAQGNIKYTTIAIVGIVGLTLAVVKIIKVSNK